MFLIRLVGRFVGFVFKAVVFVAAMAAVAAAVMVGLFDADQYKRQVEQKVLDLTGRAVSIDSANLQLGLPPRVVLNNVRVKNAPWGSRPDMARINRVTVKLDPLAAISGGNSVAEVNLEGADVLLETSAVGEANWSALAASSGAAMAAALGVMTQSITSAAPVTLSDASITIRDAAGNTNTFSIGGGSSFGIGGGSPPPYLVAGAPGPCDKDNQDPNMAATPPARQKSQTPAASGQLTTGQPPVNQTATPRKN